MQIDKETVTLITAIAGLVFGFLGAVLGVLNTWRAILRDRVRVKVTPVWYHHVESGTEGMGVEIINLSSFEITVSHVGFTMRGGEEHLALLNGTLTMERLPQRMKPLTRFTARVGSDTLQNPKFAEVRKAYAKTDCGRTFTGSSEALRGHVKRLRTTLRQIDRR